MSKYEVVYIVDARLSDGEKADIAKQVADLVTKIGGKVVNSTMWIDRQRIAFQLKKAWEGTYYLLNLEFNREDVARFRRDLLINERVLRFLIVNADELTPAVAVAVV